jgi:hypothetical protein
MSKRRNPWVPVKRLSHDEMEAAAAEFLANGGKITRLKDDDGAYDKGLKKIEKRLGGGYNPFTKEESLTED